MDTRFAHVCLIVEDIHAAMDHYRRILSVVDPPQVVEPTVFYEDFGAGEERLSFATFVSPVCEIQLMQPKTPGTPLYERLRKKGEHVHHSCFTSPRVEDVVERLAEQDIGIVEQGVSNDPQMPWQHWTFVHPSQSHGVLIELANNYDSVDGKWEPAASTKAAAA
jgi:methylmalonyl-CoA/ethylmalonyl-CoA epimerase